MAVSQNMSLLDPGSVLKSAFSDNAQGLTVLSIHSPVVQAITPTITSGSAYANGNQLGGLQTLTNVARGSGGSVNLQSLVITEKGTNKATMNIIFFNAAPTLAGDKAAFTLGTGDATKMIGSITIASGNWLTVGSDSVATVANINLELTTSGSQNLYAAVINTGTPTYASTSDLTFTYSLYQD